MESTKTLREYKDYLTQRELAEQTRNIYVKQAEIFLNYLDGRTITRKEIIAYKQVLICSGQKISTINLHSRIDSYHDVFCRKLPEISGKLDSVEYDKIISLVG